MITVCRSEARQHHRRGKHEAWLTFRAGQAAEGVDTPFGNLELLAEERLAPGGSIPPQSLDDCEVLTFVREGTLTYDDSLGHSGVIHAGEFHRMTTERSLRHVQSNASPSDAAHAFQVWLRPSHAGTGPHYEQKRFSTAERRGVLCLVGAPDGRRGSLRIRANALMFSVLLHAGQHVVHELSDRRTAWLHLVHGEVTLGDLVLVTGDGAAITAERAVSLTARKDSELLLVDLGEGAPSSSENGASG
jgi:redox-sensitive bicupin YhaK (pirin superfamily)